MILILVKSWFEPFGLVMVVSMAINVFTIAVGLVFHTMTISVPRVFDQVSNTIYADFWFRLLCPRIKPQQSPA